MRGKAIAVILSVLLLTACSTHDRFEEKLDSLTYHDGFAVISYEDITWMQEDAVPLDVYVTGTILEISDYNTLVIVDAEGCYWSVDVGTQLDLISYLGSECEVFGFCTGRISAQLGTPVINLDHDNSRTQTQKSSTKY